MTSSSTLPSRATCFGQKRRVSVVGVTCVMGRENDVRERRGWE